MNKKLSENIKVSLNLIPDKPGIYQFYDANDKILYIGKAVSLKKRVLSYFNRPDSNAKTKILVSKIARISHFVVNNEHDALLLENNLIKQHQPKYNILLKDDKTFPWICIKNEHFPRVVSTRTFIRDGSEYFGPFASAKAVKTVLEVVKQLYPLRTCNLKLTQENILAKKFKVCLEFHLGNCKAPCEARQTEKEYLESIRQVRSVISGNLNELIRFLKEQMITFASALKFEEAAAIKEKLDILSRYQAKSQVVSTKLSNIDVFGFLENEKSAFVNYLKINDGAVQQVYSVEVKKRIEETKEDILASVIVELRNRLKSESNEIIVGFDPGYSLGNIKITIPRIGDKLQLLELSQRNLKFFVAERSRLTEKTDFRKNKQRVLEKIKTDLTMSVLPRRIECFDNSNIQGSIPVASCVVFINGKPAKKEYRHFNIKNVKGPDDFLSMKEIVYRRYKRCLDEAIDLPQLIVIDGGKGQLSHAMESIRILGLESKLKVIALAKRLDEIFVPGDPEPLYIDKKSETLKIIQHIRNEAHRFGIEFHRNKRSKLFLRSELENIQGIGIQTINILLSEYKSLEKISRAPLSELAQLIGKSKAQLIRKYFTK